MNTGKLDMLGDGVLYDLSLVGHGVELDLLGVLHELGNDNGELLAHLCGHLEETLKFVEAIANVHSGS